jgi:hypothetical protein
MRPVRSAVPFIAASLLAVVSLFASGCEQILGEHTVVGDDRRCSSDDDCTSGERCDESAEYCRKRCKEDDDCGAFRECSSEMCTEPVGTPCDAEEIIDDVCHFESCADKDADGDEVLGYCTRSCSAPSECPPGYLCTSSQCRVQ